VTTTGRHAGLAQPFLIETAHGGGETDGRASDPKAGPLGTLTCKRSLALIEPLLLGQQSGATARPVSRPVPTVSTAGAIGLAQPFIVGIDNKSSDHVRSTANPLSTITTKQRHAVAEPFLLKYFGSEEGVDSVRDPLDTLTTKARFGLAQPIVEYKGRQYLLDILFRMLEPDELSLAQGFSKDYQFTGKKTEIVKQIGNAVPPPFAEALVSAAVSQNPDWTAKAA